MSGAADGGHADMPRLILGIILAIAVIGAVYLAWADRGTLLNAGQPTETGQTATPPP